MTQPADVLSTAKPIAHTDARTGLERSTKPGWRRAGVLIAIGSVAWGAVAVIDLLHGFHPHAPRLELLLGLPVALAVHLSAAVMALLIGLALMVGVKGRAFHRIAGWSWVACMAAVVLTSFWMGLLGRFSLLHVLSGWVGVTLPMAVAAVKRGDLKRHRAIMTSIFMGGLIVAGAFTLVPGRLLWRVFIG